jgi:hypothetical protein
MPSSRLLSRVVKRQMVSERDTAKEG